MSKTKSLEKSISTFDLVKRFEGDEDDARAELVVRAQKGDVDALNAIKKREGRKGRDEESISGKLTEISLVERAYAKAGDYFKWNVRQDQKRLRQEIAGENASPTEWILAEQIALASLTLNYFESIYHQSHQISIEQSRHHLHKIDLAQRRLMGAIKTLALVRRLGVSGPAVQVNVTQQTLNVQDPDETVVVQGVETKTVKPEDSGGPIFETNRPDMSGSS